MTIVVNSGTPDTTEKRAVHFTNIEEKDREFFLQVAASTGFELEFESSQFKGLLNVFVITTCANVDLSTFWAEYHRFKRS